MISQLDPMITACKHPYYEEKKKNIKLNVEKMDQKDANIKIGFFVCKRCK